MIHSKNYKRVLNGWKNDSNPLKYNDIKSSLQLALKGNDFNQQSAKPTNWLCNTKRGINVEDIQQKLPSYGITARKFSSCDWI